MPWDGLNVISVRKFTCGYCGSRVAPDRGWKSASDGNVSTHVCPQCECTSYFDGKSQTPGVRFGQDIGTLPEDVEQLYGEARDAMAVSAHTAAVLICRKLLMNVAVSLGAAAGKSFIEYVEYLANANYIPPTGRAWVDHIRTKGNEANHEMVLMSRDDAERLTTFAAMLLTLVYEFPARLIVPQQATQTP